MGTHINRRRFLGGSLAMAGALGVSPLLSACGSGSRGSDEITALLITGGTGYPEYWQQMTAQFQRKTGIKVTYDLLQFTPLISKEITLAAARSDQYDVYSTHTAQIGAFFPHFEPLNNYFPDVSDFFPATIKAFTNPSTGGLAAIPRNLDIRCQYYNTEMYRERGVKPAATWDDLIDIGPRLTHDRTYGLVLTGSGDPAQRQFTDLLWQAGGDWLDENNRPIFNTEPGVEALTFYRDLVKRYRVTPADTVTYEWNENSQAFENLMCATVFDWPDGYATYSASDAKTANTFATAPLPKHKTDISNAISHGVAVNKYSARKEAAAEFIKFIVGDEPMVQQFHGYAYYPSRKSIASKITMNASSAQKAWLRTLETAITSGREWPQVPGFNMVSPVVQTAVQNALTDQQSPKEALDAAAKEAERILEDSGAIRV